MTENKTFLFVHGTGVRKDDYRRSFQLIKAGLDKHWPTAPLRPCQWGEKVGSRLACGGVSIPDFSGEAAPSDEAKALTVLWELLATDPDFEWRELAGVAAPAGFVDAAMRDAAKAFPQRVEALCRLPAALALLPDDEDDPARRDAAWLLACKEVAASEAMAAALASIKRIDARVRHAAARACVAHWQWQRAFASGSLPAAQRDALVQALFSELGGADAGRVTDWVTARFRGAVKRWATDKARRERDVLYNAAYPAAGDILLYQARGEAIRAEIAAAIRNAGDEVVVLAHSLGGIASVDLLVQEHHPNVRALVTFGSQAPLLYELGALQSLPLTDPLPPAQDRLPATFPRTWINFYDRDDLLSYKAAPVFMPVALDVEVRSGAPFPDSHGAYWTQPPVWERLAELLR